MGRADQIISKLRIAGSCVTFFAATLISVECRICKVNAGPACDYITYRPSRAQCREPLVVLAVDLYHICSCGPQAPNEGGPPRFGPQQQIAAGLGGELFVDMWGAGGLGVGIIQLCGPFHGVLEIYRTSAIC